MLENKMKEERGFADDEFLDAESQQIEYSQGAAEVQWAVDNEDILELNLANLPIEKGVLNIESLDPSQFALIRRNGFGGSDASILMGANPFTKTYTTVSGKDGLVDPLVVQKARQVLSDSEKKVKEVAAVRKGNDLEPLILKKAQAAFGVPVMKAPHMYRFKEYPYLSMSFDGVGVFRKPKKSSIDPTEYRKEVPHGDMLKYLYAGDAEFYYPAPDFSWIANHHGYAPVEIKVATMYGQRSYNPLKAIYSESRIQKGQNPWQEAPPPLTEEELRKWSIEEKARYFGIPLYYYPQVQQEMMAVDANGGFLATLFDVDWTMHMFYIQKDHIVWNSLIIEGMKAAKAVNDIVAKEGRLPIMALNKEMKHILPKTTELKEEADAVPEMTLVKDTSIEDEKRKIDLRWVDSNDLENS